jgi:acyl-CoA synthetase (AMP-forming)/AMP-acid ligase II
VAAAATIGIPDQLYGEEVAAFVALKDEAKISEVDLISYCTERLADDKCPQVSSHRQGHSQRPYGKAAQEGIGEGVLGPEVDRTFFSR